MAERRVRAVQFQIQPVLVADDGETLQPLPANPIAVTPGDWPTFAAEKWPRILEEAQAQLNAQGE